MAAAAAGRDRLVGLLIPAGCFVVISAIGYRRAPASEWTHTEDPRVRNFRLLMLMLVGFGWVAIGLLAVAGIART